MQAQYPGRCACCDDYFPAGVEIENTPDGWVIASHLKADKPAEVCTTCFMVKAANGSCSPDCDGGT